MQTNAEDGLYLNPQPVVGRCLLSVTIDRRRPDPLPWPRRLLDRLLWLWRGMLGSELNRSYHPRHLLRRLRQRSLVYNQSLRSRTSGWTSTTPAMPLWSATFEGRFLTASCSSWCASHMRGFFTTQSRSVALGGPSPFSGVLNPFVIDREVESRQKAVDAFVGEQLRKALLTFYVEASGFGVLKVANG